ncbi:ketopantoate reductase PanE/ApbA C terminal-domain-containing protein [Blyttiomyces helicus]|uniref:2-dehydropantoate 2-reductase n=1 Tax=Blyttiomyces helicus TaxID=388810 RepID=A0A4P9W007_9FUNG|nr:ketopantoate reductase PanE/ApbA C terminal-domain-containing protein [Blyttiomyces helicus]|eukprot:RKO85384.1 ketopantoate reductase PanE/ApbA C terminal-domain-containing protein [Blyttiomyces helicus]
MPFPPPTIAILGLGLVGSYLAAHLLFDPNHSTIHLVARESFTSKHGTTGFCATRIDGSQLHVSPDKLNVHASVADLLAAVSVDFLVVTVKRVALKAVCEGVRAAGFKGVVVVVSNGARGGEEARGVLEGVEVVEGMWPFNVVESAAGEYRQASEGDVYLKDSPSGRSLADTFTRCGLPTKTSENMDSVLYGKLLVNLNNAICALSALPLRAEVCTYGYRKIWALCMTESLKVYAAAGIHPTPFLAVPYSVLPYVLRVPDSLFNVVLSMLSKIDPNGTSSMYEDVRNGRVTEIDFLQGEVVRLGREVGVQTPVCERIVGLIRELERAGKGLVPHSAEEILEV